MLWSCKTKISFLCLASLLSAARGELAGPRLVAQAQERYVMGFPVLIVLEAWGPQTVPLVDLRFWSAEMDVALSEKGGERRYMLNFDIPVKGTLTNANGEQFDDAVMWRARVENGVCRRMVMDLCSFVGGGKTLGDVPEGTYDCVITFPVSKVSSNVFTVTFVAPTEDEKTVLKALKNRGSGRRTAVEWNDFLLLGEGVPGAYLPRLRKETLRQLALHILISEVIATNRRVEDIDVKDLENSDVPTYLAPEKECLIVEIGVLSGRGEFVEGRKEKLLAQYPGLRWRLDRLVDGHWDFLSARKGR